MKSLLAVVVAALTAAVVLTPDIADAKRLGGGRSLGMQRQVTPPATQSAPSAASPTRPGAAADPVMPAQPTAPAAAARAATPPPAAAPSGMSRWLAPIAGIAAGLGLAALLSHFGLSETFASLLLVGLLAVAAIALVKFLFFRRATTDTLARQGAGAPYTRAPSETMTSRIEPTWNASTANARPFPPGFNPEPFLQQAKLQFRRLQTAYDEADRTVLSDVMTPQMFNEVSRELDARGTHVPTEVVKLDADVLDVVTEGRQHVASVRFTGLMREDGASQPTPFVEVWNLVKPVDGTSGWLLAGIQQSETALTH